MDNTVELTIMDVVYPGKGIARVDGYVVFISGVLPGETVTARIVRRKKNFAEAQLLELETPSPARIEPSCPLAGICPGCCYQHMNYAEELLLKQAQFSDLLRRIGRVGDPPILPPVPSPVPLGYRNRITLHASREQDTGTGKRLGYFAFDNRSIIEVTACPLAVDEINHLLKKIRLDRDFTKNLGDGQTLTLRHTKIDGTLYWMKGSAPGKTLLTEITGLGPVLVPYNAFFQVNIPVADALIRRLSEVLSRNSPSATVDLYCGAGLFTLAAGKAGVPAVLGIDRNRAAIRSARQNARDHGLPGLRFESMDARAGLEYGLGPLRPEETALIVDPPRAGLHRDIIAFIAARNPGMLIYISCAPDTLSRDVALLREVGYVIENTRIFDMFPRTPYFESLTVLRHIGG